MHLGPNSPYVSTEQFEAFLGVKCASTLLNWPHGEPAPPVSKLDNQIVHHAGDVLTWFRQFMTMDQVADCIGVGVPDLAKWYRQGIGPKGLLIGRRDLVFTGNSARLGDEVLLYPRSSVDYWIRPRPPGSRGDRS